MSHLGSKRPPLHPMYLQQLGERFIETLPTGAVVEVRTVEPRHEIGTAAYVAFEVKRASLVTPGPDSFERARGRVLRYAIRPTRTGSVKWHGAITGRYYPKPADAFRFMSALWYSRKAP